MQSRETSGDQGLVLVHALDGFLSAGSAPAIAAQALLTGQGEVVHSFDIDDFHDYRARRPSIRFHSDHYLDYDTPRLDVVREIDLDGRPYLVLHGPEPDFRWEAFADEMREVVEDFGVTLTLGLGAVPMGVPHTRPPIVTMHQTRPGLIEHSNLWQAELLVPSSAQSLLEYRMAQWDLDAGGFVAHIPSYLAGVDYPTGARSLLDALLPVADLRVSLDELTQREAAALTDIQRQITEQDGEGQIRGLEEQYDAFSRGVANSLLADDVELPTGDELARQFEEFLARRAKNDD